MAATSLMTSSIPYNQTHPGSSESPTWPREDSAPAACMALTIRTWDR